MSGGAHTLVSVFGVWLAALLTLAIFSFLFKDNPLYKFAEHLVVGVSAGYWLVILYSTSLTDLLLDPLVKDFTGGGLFSSTERMSALLLDLIGLILGLMVTTRVIPRVAWLGRIAIGFFLGVSAGVAIPLYLQTFVIQPLRATLIPVVPSSVQLFLAGLLGTGAPTGPGLSLWGALNNLLIVAGVFCGIVYFFFSKEHKGVTGRAATFGIWVLMIGFGSTFGFTVMSRISLLVGRFDFLLNTWLLDNLWHLLF